MIPPPAGLTPDDYDRIEEAVMETARGRWFLAEFARRVRSGDTQKILQAIERLESASAPAQFAQAQEHAKGIGERLLDVAFQLRARRVEDGLCRVVEREASAAFALAGEERGPAFAREFDAPAPQPVMIEMQATPEAAGRAVPPRAGSLSATERAAFGEVAATLAPVSTGQAGRAPAPAASAQRGPSLDDIERMAPMRRLGFFS
jgi:hypothetical protein